MLCVEACLYVCSWPALAAFALEATLSISAHVLLLLFFSPSFLSKDSSDGFNDMIGADIIVSTDTRLLKKRLTKEDNAMIVGFQGVYHYCVVVLVGDFSFFFSLVDQDRTSSG